MRRGSAALPILASAALFAACQETGQDASGEGYWSGTEPVEVARGNARRGPWRQNQSAFDWVDDPTVAIAADGHVAVAWADQARRSIFFQSFGPTGAARFASPVKVPSGADTFSWMPRLAVAPDDPARIYLLWQEIVFTGGSHGGEILFARSADGGATFGDPLNLSNSTGGDGKGQLTRDRWDNGSLDLAVGPLGNILAAWTEYEGRLLVTRSTDGGASFVKPVHIAGDAGRPARAPTLALSDSGAVYLAWSAGGAIHVAVSGEGGEISFATEKVISHGHADAPRIAADRQGTLHLVFGERSQGPFGPSRIRYARRAAAERAFSPPTTIDTAIDGATSAAFPDIAVAEPDRVLVVWKRLPGSGQASRGLGFVESRNAGNSFTQPEIVTGSDDPKLGYDGSQQGSLLRRLAMDRNGGTALVNSTFAPGRASRIWLWRKR